jgi:DNA-binding transcriptional ArsR family regulator
MDQVFQSVIDRSRAPLDIKTVKTIFGHKHRPFKKNARGKGPRFEVVVERPVYDLTVFKVHFGHLTVKIYSKGERILRIEAIVHNTRDLPCGRGIDKFPRIVELLKAILERFLSVLRSVDVSFIDAGAMETWHLPSQVGNSRIGGIDINQPRMRAVMEAVIALSINPRGFTASELAAKVGQIIPGSDYQPRQASYDLKKLRGKGLVYRTERSRRYETTIEGVRTIAAFITLREKVLLPLLANAGKRKTGPKPPNRRDIDIHYDNIQIEMQKIFEHLNIAAISTTFCRC